MTAHVAPASAEIPPGPEVDYGRTADGLLAARVGDHAFAMVPGRDGKWLLMSGWRMRGAIAAWKRSDFYSYSGLLADEAAFRAKVAENARHQRDRLALDRSEIPSNEMTPWGVSQGAITHAEGVVFHTTASHGGFRLSKDRNALVHPSLRSEGGWYEEDEASAIVILTFPQLFTSYERKSADRTLRNSWPDEWESMFGRALAPGESFEKDRRAFVARHADDWIVISAISSAHQAGYVEVIATIGGKRKEHAEERRFLILSDEYGAGQFGFVIDKDRHRPYGGPSSFVSWNRIGRQT